MEREILDVWIANKDTGAILLHQNYSGVEFVKSELFGSILSAIFNWNFSDDPNQLGINSLEIGNKALHFSMREHSVLLICAVNTHSGFAYDKLLNFFDVIIDKFAKDGWYEKVNDFMLDTDEYNKFIPVLDQIVNDFEEKLDKIINFEEKPIDQLSIKEILKKVADEEMDAKSAADLIEKIKKNEKK